MRGNAGRYALSVAAALTHVAMLAAPAVLLGGLDGRIAAFLVLSVVLALAERAGVARGLGAACPLPHHSARSGDDRLYARLAAVGGLGLLAMSWIGITQRAACGPSFTLHWTLPGALALAGIGLRGWSAATLGPTFDAPPSSQHLQTTRGPYARLAHPSEIGLVAFGLGAACLVESPLAIAAWALLVAPPSLARAALEDRMGRRSSAEQRRSLTERDDSDRLAGLPATRSIL